MHLFVVWFLLISKPKLRNAVLCCMIYFKTKIRKSIPLLCVFIYFLDLLEFFLGWLEFFTQFLWQLSGWRGLGRVLQYSQKMLKVWICLRCLECWDWFFQLRYFIPFFLFVLAWCQRKQPPLSWECSAAQPSFGIWGSLCSLKIPAAPRHIPGQHKHQAHDSAVLLQQGKYWFNRASPTDPAYVPGPQPLNQSFLRKAPFIAWINPWGARSSCQGGAKMGFCWRKGFLGQCLDLCGASGAFLML